MAIFADSVTVLATTLSFAAVPLPALSIVSATEAQIQVNQDGSSTSVDYRYRVVGAPSFTNVNKTGAGRFALDLTLIQGHTYEAQVRFNYTGGTTCWSELLTWLQTVPVPPLSSPIIGEPFFPNFGEPISGVVVFTWNEQLLVTKIEFSIDFGQNWSTVATGNFLNAAPIDVSLLASGFYIARFTLADLTELEHPGFVVNQPITYYRKDFENSSLGHMLRQGVTAGWTSSPAALEGTALVLGDQDTMALVPTDPVPVRSSSMRVTATVAFFVTGGGFQWERLWEAEHAFGGVGAMLNGLNPGQSMGILAGVRTKQMSHAVCAPCDAVGISHDSTFEIITFKDGENAANGTFIEPASEVYASWLQMTLGGGAPFCVFSPCPIRIIKYYVLLSVEEVNPNEWHVFGRVAGTNQTIEIDETFEFQDLGGDPIELDECGFAGMVSFHQANASTDSGARIFYNFGVLHGDTDCVPVIIPGNGPVPFPNPEPEEEPVIGCPSFPIIPVIEPVNPAFVFTSNEICPINVTVHVPETPRQPVTIIRCP